MFNGATVLNDKTYIPGLWGKILDNYYKKYQQKINDQKQVESDNLALENIVAIKTLRKKFNNKKEQ